jgi:hypothetical protein
MKVLELGDQLGFGLEAADELGAVGELGQDDLYRYLAVDGLLAGAVDGTISAFTDQFFQLVALDGFFNWSIHVSLLLETNHENGYLLLYRG